MVEGTKAYAPAECDALARCRLFVANVPLDWNDVDVWRVFRPYGNGCRDVRLCNPTQLGERRGRRSCFVTMWDAQSAQLARQHLHEQKHIKHDWCDVMLLKPLMVSPYVIKTSDNVVHRLASYMDRRMALRDVPVQQPQSQPAAAALSGGDAPMRRQKIEPSSETEVMVWVDDGNVGSFAVTPLSSLVPLRDLELAMLMHYGDSPDTTKCDRAPSCGAAVAVWRPNDNFTGGTWRRATVISVPKSGGEYACDCLDHLELLKVIPCSFVGVTRFSAARLREIVSSSLKCFVLVDTDSVNEPVLPVTMTVVDKDGQRANVGDLLAQQQQSDEPVEVDNAPAQSTLVYDVAALRRIGEGTLQSDRPCPKAIEQRLRQLGLHKDQGTPPEVKRVLQPRPPMKDAAKQHRQRAAKTAPKVVAGGDNQENVA